MWTHLRLAKFLWTEHAVSQDRLPKCSATLEGNFSLWLVHCPSGFSSSSKHSGLLSVTLSPDNPTPDEEYLFGLLNLIEGLETLLATTTPQQASHLQPVPFSCAPSGTSVSSSNPVSLPVPWASSSKGVVVPVSASAQAIKTLPVPSDSCRSSREEQYGQAGVLRPSEFEEAKRPGRQSCLDVQTEEELRTHKRNHNQRTAVRLPRGGSISRSSGSSSSTCRHSQHGTKTAVGSFSRPVRSEACGAPLSRSRVSAAESDSKNMEVPLVACDVSTARRSVSPASCVQSRCGVHGTKSSEGISSLSVSSASPSSGVISGTFYSALGSDRGGAVALGLPSSSTAVFEEAVSTLAAQAKAHCGQPWIRSASQSDPRTVKKRRRVHAPTLPSPEKRTSAAVDECRSSAGPLAVSATDRIPVAEWAGDIVFWEVGSGGVAVLSRLQHSLGTSQSPHDHTKPQCRSCDTEQQEAQLPSSCRSRHTPVEMVLPKTDRGLGPYLFWTPRNSAFQQSAFPARGGGLAGKHSCPEAEKRTASVLPLYRLRLAAQPASRPCTARRVSKRQPPSRRHGAFKEDDDGVANSAQQDLRCRGIRGDTSCISSRKVSQRKMSRRSSQAVNEDTPGRRVQGDGEAAHRGSESSRSSLASCLFALACREMNLLFPRRRLAPSRRRRRRREGETFRMSSGGRGYHRLGRGRRRRGKGPLSLRSSAVTSRSDVSLSKESDGGSLQGQQLSTRRTSTEHVAGDKENCPCLGPPSKQGVDRRLKMPGSVVLKGGARRNQGSRLLTRAEPARLSDGEGASMERAGVKELQQRLAPCGAEAELAQHAGSSADASVTEPVRPDAVGDNLLAAPLSPLAGIASAEGVRGDTSKVLSVTSQTRRDSSQPSTTAGRFLITVPRVLSTGASGAPVVAVEETGVVPGSPFSPRSCFTPSVVSPSSVSLSLSAPPLLIQDSGEAGYRGAVGFSEVLLSSSRRPSLTSPPPQPAQTPAQLAVLVSPACSEARGIFQADSQTESSYPFCRTSDGLMRIADRQNRQNGWEEVFSEELISSSSTGVSAATSLPLLVRHSAGLLLAEPLPREDAVLPSELLEKREREKGTGRVMTVRGGKFNSLGRVTEPGRTGAVHSNRKPVRRTTTWARMSGKESVEHNDRLGGTKAGEIDVLARQSGDTTEFPEEAEQFSLEAGERGKETRGEGRLVAHYRGAERRRTAAEDCERGTAARDVVFLSAAPRNAPDGFSSRFVGVVNRNEGAAATHRPTEMTVGSGLTRIAQTGHTLREELDLRFSLAGGEQGSALSGLASRSTLPWSTSSTADVKTSSWPALASSDFRAPKFSDSVSWDSGGGPRPSTCPGIAAGSVLCAPELAALSHRSPVAASSSSPSVSLSAIPRFLPFSSTGFPLSGVATQAQLGALLCDAQCSRSTFSSTSAQEETNSPSVPAPRRAPAPSASSVSSRSLPSSEVHACKASKYSGGSSSLQSFQPSSVTATQATVDQIQETLLSPVPSPLPAADDILHQQARTPGSFTHTVFCPTTSVASYPPSGCMAAPRQHLASKSPPLSFSEAEQQLVRQEPWRSNLRWVPSSSREAGDSLAMREIKALKRGTLLPPPSSRRAVSTEFVPTALFRYVSIEGLPQGGAVSPFSCSLSSSTPIFLLSLQLFSRRASVRVSCRNRGRPPRRAPHRLVRGEPALRLRLSSCGAWSLCNHASLWSCFPCLWALVRPPLLLPPG